MNKISVKVLIGIGVAALTSYGWADAGTSGGNVLNVGVGARAIGMGEAFTAMADDVSSLYWNPAGIALLNQSQGSFMYNQSLKDLSYNNAAVATPLENGGLGASVSYLSYGKIDGYDTQGNSIGNVNAYSGVGTLGGAWLGGDWSAGFNVKGVQGSLADVKATGFASDLGLTYIVPREVMGGTFRVATALRNLGTGMKYIDQKDPFPQQFRIGVAALEMLHRKLNVAMDYGKERGISSGMYAGLEYWPSSFLVLRTGYAGSHTESDGLRAGLGLRVKDILFDYAFSNYGDLGMSHRYELTVRFGAIRPLLTPEERRLYRKAKAAFHDERYGESVMLFDSLITMEPRYKPFQRWTKAAMVRLEEQEHMASGKMNFDYTAKLKNVKQNEDKVETNELENLLNMSEPSYARQGGSTASPEKK